jgi:hypothetical protein
VASSDFIFGEKVGKWVCEKAGGGWTHLCSAIGQTYDGKLIGGIMYDGYTGTNIGMHSRCDDPAHVTRKFYWMIFDYPFNQLGVEKVRGIVSSANLEAQRIDEKLGFIRETTLSGYFPDGDAIIYVMPRSQCRWLALGERYGKQSVSASGS